MDGRVSEAPMGRLYIPPTRTIRIHTYTSPQSHSLRTLVRKMMTSHDKSCAAQMQRDGEAASP